LFFLYFYIITLIIHGLIKCRLLIGQSLAHAKRRCRTCSYIMLWGSLHSYTYQIQMILAPFFIPNREGRVKTKENKTLRNKNKGKKIHSILINTWTWGYKTRCRFIVVSLTIGTTICRWWTATWSISCHYLCFYFLKFCFLLSFGNNIEILYYTVIRFHDQSI
jgi:hypothetical protein